MNLSESATVRSLTELVTKGTTPTTIGRSFTSEGVRFLKVETFAEDGSYIPGRESHIDDSTNQLLRRSQLAEDDILFSIAGALGRTTIVASSWLPANTNQALAIIRPSRRTSGKVLPRYLLWALRSPAIQRRIAEINVQAAQANLSLEQVRGFEIPLPSRAEQARIVEGLDLVSDQISVLSRLADKKRDIKRGMMQALLTGNIRLPGFSGAWRARRIGDFAEVKAGGTPPTSIERYWGGEIRWMSSGEIHLKRVREVVGRITKDGLAESAAQLLPVGTVLMALAGQGKTRGTVAISRVELTTNQSIAGIFPSAEHDSDFLYYNLDTRYDELRGESTGDGGRGGLNLTIIKRLEVHMPDVDEQKAIAEVLATADAEISALERRLESARAIKQGMMQELLTGRIRLVVEEVAA